MYISPSHCFSNGSKLSPYGPFEPISIVNSVEKIATYACDHYTGIFPFDIDVIVDA